VLVCATIVPSRSQRPLSSSVRFQLWHRRGTSLSLSAQYLCCWVSEQRLLARSSIPSILIRSLKEWLTFVPKWSRQMSGYECRTPSCVPCAFRTAFRSKHLYHPVCHRWPAAMLRFVSTSKTSGSLSIWLHLPLTELNPNYSLKRTAANRRQCYHALSRQRPLSSSVSDH